MKKYQGRKVEGKKFLFAVDENSVRIENSKINCGKSIHQRVKVDEWIQNQQTKVPCISIKQQQWFRKHAFFCVCFF